MTWGGKTDTLKTETSIKQAEKETECKCLRQKKKKKKKGQEKSWTQKPVAKLKRKKWTQMWELNEKGLP